MAAHGNDWRPPKVEVEENKEPTLLLRNQKELNIKEEIDSRSGYEWESI